MSTTSAAPRTRRTRRGTSPVVRRRVVDLGATVVVLGTGALTFGPVFGGSVGYAAAGAGLVAGTVVALAASRWSWSLPAVATATIVAYLALGGPLVLPSTTVGGVVPTLDTVQRLVLLTWQSWRDLLTVSVPAGEFEGPAALPLVCCLVAATVAGHCALRASRPLWPLLTGLVLLVVAIAWGSQDVLARGALGIVFAVTALTWVAWRAQADDPGSVAVLVGSAPVRVARRRRAAVTVLSAATAALVASGTVAGGTALAGAPGRDVLRDHVIPPLDLRDYASPLTDFRELETTHRDDTLLTVSDLPAGTRVRLAAMDVYDGDVYNVSEATARFAPSGTTVAPGPSSDRARQPRTMQVQIGDYRGVWLPGGGDLRGVRFSGPSARTEGAGLYVNQGTGTALTTAGVTAGTTYEVDLVDSPVPDVSDLPESAPAPLATGSPAQVEAVPAAATRMVGDATTPLAQLRAVADELRRGAFANGVDDPSLPGHTVARIEQFLGDPSGQTVGDDEQYAVAMALLADQLGVPARVVMGFYPATPVRGPLRLTGADAHVWVEAAFDGLGWVTFDPTPDVDQRPDQQQPRPQERNDPQVLPPPEVPDERDRLDPPQADSDRSDDDRTSGLPVALLYAAAGIGALGLTASPFLLVLWSKARRRRRRRHARRTADRVSGGWSELLDLSSDLGTRLPRSATRPEASRLLLAAHGADASRIAGMADAGVFGETEPSERDVEEMWRQVDDLRDQVLHGLSPRARWRSRLSLASLRRPADASGAGRRLGPHLGHLLGRHPRRSQEDS